MKKIIFVPSMMLAAHLMVGCGPAPTSPAGTVAVFSAGNRDALAKPMARPSANGQNSAFPTSAPTSAPTTAPTSAPSAAASGSPAPSATGTPGPAATLTPPTELVKENTFKDYGSNPFVDPLIDRLSTFAVDVDTASYTWMRKAIQSGYLPDKNSVRLEEYINYFDYVYPAPTQGPFAIYTEMAPIPMREDNTHMLQIGLQGKTIPTANRKDAVLTFVVDVSGSMNMENRLGLVKQSLSLLLKQLRPTDQVGIVIFGSTARVLQEHIPAANQQSLLDAIERLRSEGATNAEAGLTLGYQQAGRYFKPGANNRVILCSDGVANVGLTGPDAMLTVIKQKAEVGISLSTLGFGMGNYNDVLMEQLANKGDGNYAYVDTLQEAERVLVQNLTGTLQTIAKDTKVQVDFNPEMVSAYRLIGYENRNVADQDFRNDAVDAGEVGSGHQVTALYEVRLKTTTTESPLATVTLRYKDPDNADRIGELNQEVKRSQLVPAFTNTSPSFRLAAAVSGFGEILKQSGQVQNQQLTNIISLAQNVQQQQSSDKLTELMTLMYKAQSLINPASIIEGPRTP